MLCGGITGSNGVVGYTGGGGAGWGWRMALHSGSPRVSRGISPMVPPTLLLTYSGDGAHAVMPDIAPDREKHNSNLVRAFIGAACYTART